MYKLNKIGPRTDPCGASILQSRNGEHASLILEHCFLKVRYDYIHVNVLVEKLNLDNLDKRTL